MTSRPDGWKPRARAGIAERIIDGEALLVNAQGGEILVLNSCGALVWALLDGQHDVNALVARVCEEHEVDEATARKDVQAFLSALETRGVLQAG